MKTLVKAGVSRSTPGQLVGISNYVVGKMTGNVAFATPTPSLASISAATTTLQVAITAAESRATEAIAHRNTAASALRTLMADLARYVNSASNGNSDTALSSGFDAVAPRSPIAMVAPAYLKVRTGDIEGSLDLNWPGVRGAHMYQVYMTLSDAPVAKDWQVVGVTTRSRFTKTDLVANKPAHFRVTAVGALGEGAASEIVTGKAA
ncbi:MAG: fibronectin type III domain-containing protein [Flavobacteriales bacterium]